MREDLRDFKIKRIKEMSFEICVKEKSKQRLINKEKKNNKRNFNEINFNRIVMSPD